MKAATWAQDPPKKLDDIIAEVQAAANHTQSEAYRFEDAGDGSLLEIRCAPEPAVRVGLEDDLPVPGPDVEGFLAVAGDTLLRCRPRLVSTDEEPRKLARQDDGARLRQVRQVTRRGDPYETDNVPEADTEETWGLVEFEWQPEDVEWKEHAVKKATDVRLTPLASPQVNR